MASMSGSSASCFCSFTFFLSLTSTPPCPRATAGAKGRSHKPRALAKIFWDPLGRRMLTSAGDGAARLGLQLHQPRAGQSRGFVAWVGTQKLIQRLPPGLRAAEREVRKADLEQRIRHLVPGRIPFDHAAELAHGGRVFAQMVVALAQPVLSIVGVIVVGETAQELAEA